MKTINVVLLLLCILGVLILTPWIAVLNPKLSVSSGAEAVVVFAGGNGERLDLGLSLVKTHGFEYMFLSVGAVNWPDRQRVLDYCSTKHQTFVVYCIRTDIESDNTQGEAKLFAAEAKKLGLNHLIAVTGKSHSYRASLRLSQYFEGSVDRMGAAENPPLKLLVHEWLGIIHARLFG